MGKTKDINWELVELYVKAGSKQVDICKAFYIDEETLRSRVKKKYGIDWSAFSAKLHSEGNLLIEAQQFQKAMKGYWPAMLWLGKVRLGQREPEMLNQLAANQPHIDQSHLVMQLQHRISELEANADKSETE